MESKLPTDLDRLIGERIRIARESSGVSMIDLANELGIAFQQQHKYERGINRVPASRLAEIARILGTPVSWFFGEGEPGDVHLGKILTKAIRAIGLTMPDEIIEAAKRTPYSSIGDYMERYTLFRTNDVWVRVHHILRSDQDRDLHDHPWDYVTLLLRGGYTEVTPDGQRFYGAGSVLARRAEALHRLIVPEGETCWTLFMTGPKIREWGFQTEFGWMHWKDYLENPLDIRASVAHNNVTP